MTKKQLSKINKKFLKELHELKGIDTRIKRTRLNVLSEYFTYASIIMILILNFYLFGFLSVVYYNIENTYLDSKVLMLVFLIISGINIFVLSSVGHETLTKIESYQEEYEKLKDFREINGA